MALRIPFDRSRPGAWISAGLHGSLLLAAIVGFSSGRLPPSDEGIPVEVMTDTQFSEMTRGERQAAKPLPDAKPRADRVADKREERDPGEAKVDAPSPPKRPAEAKVAEEETEAAAAPPPPRRVAEAKPEPAPAAPPARPDTSKADAAAAAAAKAAADAKAAEARKVEAERLAEKQEAEAMERARVQAAREAEQQKQAAKAQADAKAAAEAKAQAAAEAKAQADARAKAAAVAKAKADAEAKAELDAKMKQLAEAEARAEADAKAKAAADAKAKALAQAKAKADAETKARKQAEAADKFSPGDISKLLASKDASQSTGATGREVQRTASLGTATGNAQKLNPSQREQLIGLLSEQLHRCWQVPVAAQTADKPPVPVIRVKLNADGTLAAEPIVTNSGSGLFQTVAESATRATRRCAPLRIPAQFQPYYNDWRDLLVNFDPRAIG